jgi:hypothetical protein
LNDSEKEIKTEMDVESKKQALADYLRIDPKKISAFCQAKQFGRLPSVESYLHDGHR